MQEHVLEKIGKIRGNALADFSRGALCGHRGSWEEQEQEAEFLSASLLGSELLHACLSPLKHLRSLELWVLWECLPPVSRK